jgi:hypothetical protein
LDGLFISVLSDRVAEHTQYQTIFLPSLYSEFFGKTFRVKNYINSEISGRMFPVKNRKPALSEFFSDFSAGFQQTLRHH